MVSTVKYVSLCLLFASCLPTVQLQAPPPTAVAQERIKAYEQLKPAPTTVYFNGTTNLRASTVLPLNGGAFVYKVEDLLPVISRQSETANWVIESMIQTKKARGFQGLFFAGLALSLTLPGPIIPDEPGVLRGTALATVVLVPAATLLSLIPARKHAKKATHAQRMAVSTYDTSLLAYLNLCYFGNKLYGCESTSVPPSQPASLP